MKTILDKIVDYKTDELASIRRRVPLRDVQLQAGDAAPALPYTGGFKKGALNIIAEVKKASPSAGVIRPDFNPLDIAFIYQDNGARALSILTDENFFQGSLDYLKSIKTQVTLPCLRKDFTLSEYHLYEARGAGADAILLIAAILDHHQLKDYQALAWELGMTVLVEVHDEQELKKIEPMGAKLVGVNNRNLKTFKVDVQVSLDLNAQIPEGIIRISESGLNTHDDLVKLMEAGFNGFLIGEAMMKEKDIGKKLREFLGGH